MNDISLISNGKMVSLPNRWEGLTQKQYQLLVKDLLRMAAGEISPGEVRIRLLCNLMDWKLSKIKDEETMATLIALSQRLTFLFNEDQEGRFLVNLCFCAQLMPKLVLNGTTYEGYHVRTDFNQLTCSLTALQYLEARALISQGNDSLPFMAAILYCPGTYDSERAHALSKEFAKLPMETLVAISWNFQAINTFLFTKTEFSLLAKFKEKNKAAIATDAMDALYDLSADGLGNNQEVEQMNVLTYLRILRKKTIDTVRQMRGLKMDTPTISLETGLPIEVINDMI